ncbi:hypothetical protein CEUSTIGMA_g6323.t1 [Chlamydomonas eustigma]|uniref:Uncharacterized protein n=1 Tax=Chlamydomonas eustigma TaxID=1157962 RepID=A0A250X723_9CHLO|nr:hypothetical protein CEUSTIGMA_g6323.t1 [Chlamydomonas eustigma]|eukprot:GAX78884.1 hypothetical protein CEUSTIGMA_g6323.t1 [Chlamydomonas eustigma]
MAEMPLKAQLDESTDILEEPGAVEPAEIPEPPAKIVEHETVPPPEFEHAAEEIKVEETGVQEKGGPKKPATPPAAEKPKTPIIAEPSEADKTAVITKAPSSDLTSTAEKSDKLAGLKKKPSAPAPGVLPSITRKKSIEASANAKESTVTKTASPSLPAIKQRSKIPSASPQRINRPSPGRSRIPTVAGSEGETVGGGSAGNARDLSPGGGWNMFNREHAKPKPQVAITGPSEEERLKRRQWAFEKRRREEAKARAEAERAAMEESKRKEEEEAKLEHRRAQIRERILRQQEIAARQAYEEAAAEERARQEISRFKGQKPLFEKLQEEYEHMKEQQEDELQRRYVEEVGRFKVARPHQIIAGEVVVKPTVIAPREEKRDVSASRPARKSPRPTYLSDNADSGNEGMASAVVASARNRRKASQQVPTATTTSPAPQVGGLVLYSRSTKQALPRLEERAVSPFIFNADQQPVNVPEQSQFWSSKKTNVLNVENSDSRQLASVEEGEAGVGDVDVEGAGDEGLEVEHDEEGVQQMEGSNEEEQLLEQLHKEEVITGAVETLAEEGGWEEPHAAEEERGEEEQQQEQPEEGKTAAEEARQQQPMEGETVKEEEVQQQLLEGETVQVEEEQSPEAAKESMDLYEAHDFEQSRELPVKEEQEAEKEVSAIEGVGGEASTEQDEENPEAAERKQEV